MDKDDSVEPVFAIVEFDDGKAIIRRDWAIFNTKGQIISSHYPPKDLAKHLIKEDFTPTKEWCDVDEKPYPVVKHIKNSPNYKDAIAKFKVALQLSEVDTDDNVNNQKMKESRKVRCKKMMSSDDDSEVTKDYSEINDFKSHIQCPPNSKKRKLENDSVSIEESGAEGVQLETVGSNEVKAVDSNRSQAIENEEELVRPWEENQEEFDKPSGENDKEFDKPSGENNEECDKSLEETTEEVNMPSQSTASQKEVEKEGAEKENKLPNRKGDRGGKSRSKFCDKPEDYEKWNCTEKDIRVFKKLNTIGLMLDHICSNFNGVRQPQDDSEDVELADFPATTDEEAKLLEEKLKKKKFSQKVIKFITSIGRFRSLSMSVKNALNRLISPQVGIKYTFQGRSGKKDAFEKTRFCRVVHKSMNELYSSKAETNEINRWVKDWLAQCGNTLKRDKERIKRKNKSEEAQKLLDVDDDEDEDENESKSESDED